MQGPSSLRRLGGASRKRGEGGFSLAEMMLMIAIVGLLASVAIPGYLRYIRRAQRTEAIHNLNKIATAAQAYYAAHQSLPVADAYVSSYTSAYKYGYGYGPSWYTVCTRGGTAQRSDVDLYFKTYERYYVWNKLLFYPEGNVRYTYNYYGWSNRAAGGESAYAMLRAYRSPNCGAGGTYRWEYNEMHLRYNTQTTALERQGPYLREY
ncbi:MAG: hypothetical protein H6707_09560 [Deltaproteobacteria bacterium]|nr:hypothetical protein [Deltaproteobacteria bacterium]